MKSMNIKAKILSIILIIIIIAGIIVIGTKGFNFDLKYEKSQKVELYLEQEFEINDIKAMSFVEGGSTITQQLCKNIYFTQEKKLERKVAEVFMAFEVEKECEKDEILELYINTSYFGNGYDTVKEASLGYFNKLPSELTDGECIMLAGIPNAPSVYAPNVNMDLAKQRQKQVITKMIECGYLTQEEADKIISEE